MLGTLDVHRDLLERGAAHEVLHLPRNITHADQLPAALRVSPDACVVVHVLTDEAGALVALAVPAGAVPDLDALARRARLGALRAAAPALISARTDYRPTLVCPLGLPPDMPLYVDATLGGSVVLYVTSGDPSTAIKIRSVDLLTITKARVDRFACALDPGEAAGPARFDRHSLLDA